MSQGKDVDGIQQLIDGLPLAAAMRRWNLDAAGLDELVEAAKLVSDVYGGMPVGSLPSRILPALRKLHVACDPFRAALPKESE